MPQLSKETLSRKQKNYLLEKFRQDIEYGLGSRREEALKADALNLIKLGLKSDVDLILQQAHLANLQRSAIKLFGNDPIDSGTIQDKPLAYPDIQRFLHLVKREKTGTPFGRWFFEKFKVTIEVVKTSLNTIFHAKAEKFNLMRDYTEPKLARIESLIPLIEKQSVILSRFSEMLINVSKQQEHYVDDLLVASTALEQLAKHKAELEMLSDQVADLNIAAATPGMELDNPEPRDMKDREKAIKLELLMQAISKANAISSAKDLFATAIELVKKRNDKSRVIKKSFSLFDLKSKSAVTPVERSQSSGNLSSAKESQLKMLEELRGILINSEMYRSSLVKVNLESKKELRDQGSSINQKFILSFEEYCQNNSEENLIKLREAAADLGELNMANYAFAQINALQGRNLGWAADKNERLSRIFHPEANARIGGAMSPAIGKLFVNGVTQEQAEMADKVMSIAFLRMNTLKNTKSPDHCKWSNLSITMALIVTLREETVNRDKKEGESDSRTIPSLPQRP